MRNSVMIFLLLAILLPASLALAFPAKKVYQKTSRSVVLIVSGDGGGDNLVGAGSVITDSGLVLTNAHVVVDKATSRPYPWINVFVKPEVVTGSLNRDLRNKHGASVLTYDAALDLALLKVDGFGPGIGAIALADPADIAVGEEVVAIGHPEQGGLWSLTYGRISGQIADRSGVKGKDVFQTDTSVNRGNSGGPLLDRRGYMVGVNTSIARLGEGNMPITGVNFAVKSSVVKAWLDRNGYSLAYGGERLEGEEARPARAEAGPSESKPGSPAARESAGKGPEEATSSGEDPLVGDALDELEKVESEDLPSDTILTPKRPVEYEDIYKEVESEMENLMEEMRMKIRK